MSRKEENVSPKTLRFHSSAFPPSFLYRCMDVDAFNIIFAVFILIA